ncbi:hypothetical protein F6R97_13620 [Pseudomonas sp. JV414]|nr:hypothetical protein [Pseudomonas sp. JV414]
MQPVTLCVTFNGWNAERPLKHSHAERGNHHRLQSPRPIRSIIPYRFCPRPFLDSLRSPARLWASQRSTE